MDVSHLYDRQAQYAASASKDWETYESFKAKPKEPTPAEISLSVPPSKATQQSDAAQAQLRSFQFYNSKNLERDNAFHEQLKQQIQKDGYITKAAIIAQNYSSRSDKGKAMFGS